MTYSKELTAAIQAVTQACRLCTDVQQNISITDTVEKSDRSPVTIADMGSQALITRTLLHVFPKDPIVGEEDADPLEKNARLKKKILDLVNFHGGGFNEGELMEILAYGSRHIDYSKRFWTLDPIDGTKGFLRGDQYAIALALVEKGKVIAGVLGCPHLPVDAEHPASETGCLFFAEQGSGAFFYPLSRRSDIRKLHTDSIRETSHARFCESVETGHVSHAGHAEISSLLGITSPPYRIDSQCKYAAVARGDASIYLRLPRMASYREKIWDHAAGSIIVEEAGGQVTDFEGVPLDFSTGRTLTNSVGLVATNGRIHEQVLAAIQQVLKIDEGPQN